MTVGFRTDSVRNPTLRPGQLPSSSHIGRFVRHHWDRSNSPRVTQIQVCQNPSRNHRLTPWSPTVLSNRLPVLAGDGNRAISGIAVSGARAALQWVKMGRYGRTGRSPSQCSRDQMGTPHWSFEDRVALHRTPLRRSRDPTQLAHRRQDVSSGTRFANRTTRNPDRSPSDYKQPRCRCTDPGNPESGPWPGCWRTRRHRTTPHSDRAHCRCD